MYVEYYFFHLLNAISFTLFAAIVLLAYFTLLFARIADLIDKNLKRLVLVEAATTAVIVVPGDNFSIEKQRICESLPCRL